MEYKKQIRAHIAKGETEKAIALLMEYTQQEDSPYKDDAVLISGQFRQWKREVNLGIDQSSSNLRRIELSIMELLNQKNTPVSNVTAQPNIPPPVAAAPENSNKKYFIYGGIGLALLLLVFAISEMGGDDDYDNDQIAEELVPKESEFENNDKINQTEENYSTESEVTPNTGLDVTEVVYEDDYETEIGSFVQVKNTDVWIEKALPSNEVKATFKEIDRDVTSVYLYDKERDYNIRLDIKKYEIWFSKGEEVEKKLYSIAFNRREY